MPFTSRSSRRQTALEPSNLADESTALPPPSGSRHQVSHSMTELLEPAMEGPPSPERIRAFQKQVKRRSFIEKHLSQHTTSSGSSSHRSSAADRPSWEQGMDVLSISRNSSQRSSKSKGVPRERPESVMMQGKNLLNRMPVLRREHSDYGADTSSSNSFGTANETISMPRDQRFMAAMFSRRRTANRGELDMAQRKLQISGPFNFQHLTHAQRDNLPDLDRTSRMDLVSEFSGLRAGQKPSRGSLKGIQASELNSVSPEELLGQDSPSVGVASSTQEDDDCQWSAGRQKDLPPTPEMDEDMYAQNDAAAATASPPRRVPYTRPARSSSIGQHPFVSPIPPPPRMSSRLSTRQDDYELPPDPVSPDRPGTGLSFRQSRSYNPSEGLRPWSTSQDSASPVGSPGGSMSPSQAYRRESMVAEDAGWPLASNTMASLPEVPEEEDHPKTGKSRVSLTSNHSSLRGSVSVPFLRRLSTNPSPQRPLSNTSDTLGRFDLAAAQQAFLCSVDDDDGEQARGTWEDDIDYCYDHAAEADCDFAWERPSWEGARPTDRLRDPTMVEGLVNEASNSCVASPKLGVPSTNEIPALSPGSNVSESDVLTPASLNVPPVTSNFSLPQRGHNRNLSRSSSFKESQGFTLSPSLLIPNDFHQQMLNHEREDDDDADDDDFLTHVPSFNRSALHVRSSGSTVDSAMSEHSLSSSRHKSAASNSTAFTRWTNSSIMTGTECWQQHGELSKPTAMPDMADDSEDTMTPSGQAFNMTLPEFENRTTTSRDPGFERHNRAASESANLLMQSCNEAADASNPTGAREALKMRKRSRTTSRSHNNPPAQLSLFPNLASSRV